MIQDIHPHRFDMAFKTGTPRDGDYVIVLDGDKVLLDSSESMKVIPRHAALKTAYPEMNDALVYLFAIDDKAVYFYPASLPEVTGYGYSESQFFRNFQPMWMAFVGITATHLAHWYEKNKFCGTCGSVMAARTNERAMTCPACGATAYPAIAPAVIVGVIDEDRIIMIRYANRPYARLALIAGFMDVGETFEDTVRREVMEEVGVKVKNIRYYKSQPWGFSGSVLAGFFADLDGSPEITMDPIELQEAIWVKRTDMESRKPDISLTSEMMEVFRLNRVPE